MPNPLISPAAFGFDPEKISRLDDESQKTAAWREHYFSEVRDELARATKKHPTPMRSTHEGYAVLQEEVEEAWDDIKKNRLDAARKEMIQVAAMAMRWLIDSQTQENFG